MKISVVFIDTVKVFHTLRRNGIDVTQADVDEFLSLVGEGIAAEARTVMNGLLQESILNWLETRNGKDSTQSPE